MSADDMTGPNLSPGYSLVEETLNKLFVLVNCTFQPDVTQSYNTITWGQLRQEDYEFEGSLG